MNLSAPKSIVFIISVVLALAGTLASLGVFAAPLFAAHFWLIGGFVLLALGNLLNGL